MAGTLVMAATDLGNRGDIPARSLEAIRSADLLVFEEARLARQFLKTAGVHREFLQLTEHREKDTLATAEEALRNGKTVLYMSDQGSPGLADPGSELAAIAYAAGATVRVIPGPSALTAALSACPFPIPTFSYLGFPPREKEARRRFLQEASAREEPFVLLDTPYRRVALLEACAAVMGNRSALLALDISGPDETFRFGPLSRLATRPAGEVNFVLVVGPRRAP